MPKVVFSYFSLKGLGEAVRMLLAYGGEEFEDRRVSLENWPEIKPQFPFGQLPVLEIDGKEYAQSMAIGRYLGRKYGLNGANIEENFEIDQNLEFLTDLRIKVVDVAHAQDPEEKKAIHEKNSKEHYPGMLKKLNEIIMKNNGHIACGKLTWADFIFAGIYDFLKKFLDIPNLESQYPAFKDLHSTVCSLPKVKEFIDNSPPYEFDF